MSHCSARYNVAIDCDWRNDYIATHSFGVIIRVVSLYGINDEVA